MTQILKTIGRSLLVGLPGVSQLVPAKVDTGAYSSALWVSDIRETDDQLHFVLFDPSSPYYNGEVLALDKFDQVSVVSSNGGQQMRYLVDLPMKVDDTEIVTRFTLADRKAMTYPVLLGRHFIRGKFTIDVGDGLPHEFVRELRNHREKRHNQAADTQEGV